jgi:hypothetical protein
MRFLSAGRSAVPGTGESAHLRLAGAADDSATCSLFIKQYRQLPPLDDMAVYSLAGRGLGDGAPPILIWRRGGLVYHLVSNTEAGLGLLRKGLGAPEPKKPY